MNKNNRAILDIVFYIIVFFLIQLFFMYLVRFVEVWISENSLRYALFALKGGPILTGKMLATASILFGVFSICFFSWRKWTPVSRAWIRTKPWFIFFWVTMAALGSILPSQWIIEQTQYTMPESQQQLFEEIMREPLGYGSCGCYGRRGGFPWSRAATLARYDRRTVALGGHYCFCTYLWRCASQRPTVYTCHPNRAYIGLDVLQNALDSTLYCIPLRQQYCAVCHV